MFFMGVFQNIFIKFSQLQDDFLGISINLIGIGEFFLNIFFALGLFALFYFLGEKVRQLFLREYKTFSFFVSIALGYIIVGTGLGILGLLSLLTPVVVLIYFIGFGIVAFWGTSKNFFKRLYEFLNQVWNEVNVKSFFVWGVLLFVLIAFLRLMTPEMVEDGYHTDNAKLFVVHHTTMIPSKEALHTLPFPQLPEMIYTIPLFLNDREGARFIHFGFYVLIIGLLFTFAKQKQYRFASFLPLLFATTPVVIRNSPTQYTDFFAIFCFLLAIFLIEKKMSKKHVFFIGLLFGAVVSAKVWMLVYLPAVLLYLLVLNLDVKALTFLFKKRTIQKLFVTMLLFLTGYFVICGVWYVRAYLLTGNPAFPILNAVIIPYDPLAINSLTYDTTGNYFGLNIGMFVPDTLMGLSPFFFLALISFLFIVIIRTNVAGMVLVPLFILACIFTVMHFFVKLEWARYLLMWTLITGGFVTYGIVFLYQKSRVYRYGLITAFLIVFSYYFATTILMLPYGFGWADKNAYLTRILSRDNASYYDFDRLFNKHISEKDLVGIYRYVSFYYVDFSYIDVGYVLKKRESFDKLKKEGVTKLAIMGGDIEWFCKTLLLKDCDATKVELLATFPDFKKYNLYELK